MDTRHRANTMYERLNYELSQVNRVKGGNIKLKITSDKGETKWIALLPDTFTAVKAALVSQGQE